MLRLYSAARRLATLIVLAAPLLAQGSGIITTIAGTGVMGYSGDDGPGINAQLNFPNGVAVDGLGNVYFTDSSNGRVRKIDAAGTITTVAGCGFPPTIACATVGLGDGGPATAPFLAGPVDVVVDAQGAVYFSDSGNQRIRRISPDGVLSTVAGGGPDNPGNGGLATNAKLTDVEGLALDGLGNIYFAESQAHRIRKVNAAGMISLVAGTGQSGFSGDGGPATEARINLAIGVAADSEGNVYIADSNNNRIRKVNAAGIITTFAGGGPGVFSAGDGGPATNAVLVSPQDVEVDAQGTVWIAETLGNRIRKVDGTGIITAVAGNGGFTYSGDNGPATEAALWSPRGIAIGGSGIVYIADTLNHRVRKIGAAAPPPAQPPAISADGVTNGASFESGIVPGAWATIKGTNLATSTKTWDNAIVNGRLPTTLDGVTVTIDGQQGYIYYVNPGQINFIVPQVGAGPKQLTVTSNNGVSSSFTVTSRTHQPAFFPWPNNQAVATRNTDFSWAAANGTFAGAQTVPAKPGEVIVLWGTGFGPTNPAAPAGLQTPSDQTYATSTPPTVTLNNQPVTVFGAALTPGFAGLYQVAIEVPADMADGDWPVRATIGGVESPTGIVLSVRK